MVCASFLVKDLHVDWRRGERFYREHLTDGDLSSNAGNWQWVAGTGLDAAPYFRVFNPDLQAERFDPDGAYVRRWAPDRPEPIVEHDVERRRTLDLYAAAAGRPAREVRRPTAWSGATSCAAGPRAAPSAAGERARVRERAAGRCRRSGCSCSAPAPQGSARRARWRAEGVT